MRLKTQQGFTLIELLITVAIIGILASIAIPSYRDSVIKSRRTDAKSALTQASAAMERYFTERQTYSLATLGTNAGDIFSTASSDGYYTLSFSVVPTAAVYTLQAAPTAGLSQTSDTKCGTFTLNQLGTKTVSGTGSVSDCW